MDRVTAMEKESAHTGRLPKGCSLCRKGEKLVLLVTGKCTRRCCYCPLSREKRGKDVFFANERRIHSTSEMIDEARLMDAKGTGITGGDPLAAIDRTVNCIRTLKKEFGREHHIHLYTSDTTRSKIDRVARAGLDEIRFHPPESLWPKLRSTSYADAVKRCKLLGMSTGIEVPVMPGRSSELEMLIATANELELDFVNLNELEFSETNWRSLRRLGYDVKDDVSSAVKGSQSLALRLLRTRTTTIPLHYCSSSFKDGIQLRRRIMRRARHVKKPHEILTDDGTLVKGVIETSTPAATTAWLVKKYGIPGKYVWNDREKDRVEIAPWIVEEIAPRLDLDTYIVEEYPTADRLEVERRPLRRR